MLIAMGVSLVFTYLCHLGGQKPARGNPPGAAARHPAVGADLRLPVGHRGVVHVAGAGQGVGAGSPRSSPVHRPAWNMAFSFYQSLRTIPDELKEAATCSA